MRPVPSRSDLQEALQAARIHLPLDEAMQSPPVALALTNTANALAARREAAARRPLIDHKRRAAGDVD